MTTITYSGSIEFLSLRRLSTAGAFALAVLSGSAVDAAPPPASAAASAHSLEKPASPGAAASPAGPAQTPEQARVAVLLDYAERGINKDKLPETLTALRALKMMDPAIETICNLGLIARRVGSHVEAAENLGRCLKAYDLVPPGKEAKVRIEGLILELAMAKGSIATVVIEAPPNATLMIDGQPLGRVDASHERYLDPGWHTFAVTAGGQTLHERSNLSRGSKQTLTFDTSTRGEKPPPTWPLLVGWVLSASAATAGTALFTTAVVNQNNAQEELTKVLQSNEGCSHPDGEQKAYCAAYSKSYGRAGDFRQAALGLFAAGGALAIGTTIFMVRRSPSSPHAVVGLGSLGVVVPF